MGGQRKKHHCINGGPDHRAASREGVCSGAGWCRDQDSIAAPVGERPPIHVHEQFDHLRFGTLYDDFVEREPRVQDLSVAMDLVFDQETSFGRVLASCDK